MTFEEAALEKHQRGAKEHGDWDDINPRKEAQSELLDLYNYAAHHNFPKEIVAELRGLAKYYWKRLNF